MLYAGLYLVGAGDLHAGNIVQFQDESGKYRFGNIDLDDVFMRHVSILKLQKHLSDIGKYIVNIGETLENITESLSGSDRTKSEDCETILAQLLAVSKNSSELNSKGIDLFTDIDSCIIALYDIMGDRPDKKSQLANIYNVVLPQLKADIGALTYSLKAEYGDEKDKIGIRNGGFTILNSQEEQSETRGAHVLHDMDCEKPCRNFLFHTKSDVAHPDINPDNPFELFWGSFNFSEKKNRDESMTAKSLLDAAVFVMQKASEDSLKQLIKDPIQEVRDFNVFIGESKKTLREFFDGQFPGQDVFMEEHKLKFVKERYNFLKHLAVEYQKLDCYSSNSCSDETLKEKLETWCHEAYQKQEATTGAASTIQKEEL